MSNKVIFVNGPKRSGKDTATLFAVKHFGARHYKMAWPMKSAVAAMFGLSHEEERHYFETDAKDAPQARFFGKSPRQVLIDYSERWAKQLFGDDIFGELAVRFIQSPTEAPFTIISDSGFRGEAARVVGWLGAARCMMIQLSRPGCTFEGDSRSYVDLTDLGVTTVELHNSHTRDIFEKQVEHVIGAWLKE